MTVVVAISENGVGYMAADSQVSTGYTSHGGAVKIYAKGAAVVGVAGSAIYGPAVQDFPDLRGRPDKPLAVVDVEGWLDALTRVLYAWSRERGHGAMDGRLLMLPVELLIATPIGVWGVGPDLAVVWIPRAWAIGSGAEAALGALYGTQGRLPQDRAAVAVAAAIEHVNGCGGLVQTARTG